jgi:hypothetical protein
MKALDDADADGGTVAKARRNSQELVSLAAAYREGLGLAAIEVFCDPAGIRIATAEPASSRTQGAAQSVPARWWCRRASDAGRVTAAAKARLRPGSMHENDGKGSTPSALGRVDVSQSVVRAGEAIRLAARRLDVALHSEEEIFVEAMTAVRRVEDEIARLQAAGAMRDINKSYRKYRIETTGRGERVMRYQDWMRQYKENLVRQIASSLRYF